MSTHQQTKPRRANQSITDESGRPGTVRSNVGCEAIDEPCTKSTAGLPSGEPTNFSHRKRRTSPSEVGFVVQWSTPITGSCAMVSWLMGVGGCLDVARVHLVAGGQMNDPILAGTRTRLDRREAAHNRASPASCNPQPCPPPLPQPVRPVFRLRLVHRGPRRHLSSCATHPAAWKYCCCCEPSVATTTVAPGCFPAGPSTSATVTRIHARPATV